MVTQGSMSTPAHADLAAAEADMCRQYRLSLAGVVLPGGEKFFMLVHHGSGMLSAAAFDFANHLLKDLANKSAVADGIVWQTSMRRVEPGSTFPSESPALPSAHLSKTELFQTDFGDSVLPVT
eukprot:6476833-Amphidinium_carterae.1